MKYQRMKIEYFRKFQSQIEFKFGKKITVISGVNGIGKSSLLALMASTSGTTDRRLSGQQFQPEFMDLFNISPNEEYSKYRLFVEFDEKIGSKYHYYLNKRISFKNDARYGRGIRTIPRTHTPLNNTNNITVNQAAKDAGTTSKRVQVPTIYISLSRLVPLGESGVESKNIRSNNKIIKSGYTEFFRKCYNSVLNGSIDKDSAVSFITKEAGSSKKKYLALQVKGTTNETMSVGQDNLETIISAFTDFYALKKELGSKYIGGIICIDELDASLHPSAVRNLWTLMKNLADELDLQIILTSHSLTILKEICHLQAEDNENYRLVYFKDDENPRLSNTPDYKTLKADMFDKTYGIRPKIKVYCEDKNTKLLFELLYNALKKADVSDNNDMNTIENLYGSLSVIDILLGKDHLKSLPRQDDYFRTALIVLDGDSKIKNFNPEEALKQSTKDFERGKKAQKFSADNIISLPSFYPPEIYIYKIISEVAQNYTEYSKFWNHIDTISEISNMTSRRMKSEFLINDPNLTYEKLHNKSIAKKAIEFAKKSDLITYYYQNENNKSKLKLFKDELIKALNAIRKTKTKDVFG